MARVVAPKGALRSVLGSVRTRVRSLGSLRKAKAMARPLLVVEVVRPTPLKSFTKTSSLALLVLS